MALLEELLELEHAALERWCRGDPMGFAELADEGMTYVEPFLPARVDGLPAFQAHMAGLRGRIRAERFEILDPVLQADGGLALLSFRFRSWTDGAEARWNATEAFRRGAAGWRLIHSHWSQPAEG